jgi:DNA-binding MarR family transcriptional regulator
MVTKLGISLDADADLAAGLLEAIGPIRRVLRRALRRDVPGGDLPQAQLEVLGLVSRQPGVRVREVASVLQLAANSVSTLVNQLVAVGLIRRERDAADRRSVQLRVTGTAEQILAVRRDYRREAVQAALSELTADDRAQLQAALPAFGRLVARLEDLS